MACTGSVCYVVVTSFQLRMRVVGKFSCCMIGNQLRGNDVMHSYRQRLAIGARRNGDRFMEGHAHPCAGRTKEPADVRAGFHAAVEGVEVAIAAIG